MSTLKDIAEYVGVSVSTVSRVVNNDTSRHVNEETRKKIWQAVQELGYEPNESARRLVQNKKEQKGPSMQVGCIVYAPSLREHHPYFSPILNGVNKELFDSGYTVAFIHSLEEVRNEAVLHKAIQENRLDGMIIVGMLDASIIDYIVKHVPAVVGIDVTSDVQSFAIVDYDRLSAIRSAIEHLVSQGHRKIGFVGGDLGLDGGEEEPRFTGYKHAIREAGLELNPNWIVETDWKVDRSYSGMIEMIERQADDLPTAILAASDIMAISAMRAATEKGLRIPDDIAFVGVDNIEVSEYTSPPLSSIHIPKHEIGSIAAKTLIDYMQGRSQLPVKLLLPHRLVIRESSNYRRD